MKSWQYPKYLDTFTRWYDTSYDPGITLYLKRNFNGVWIVDDEHQPATPQDKIDTVALAAII